MLKTMYVYSDGGARGNPGPAAGGAVVYEATADGPGEKLAEASIYFPHATNNVAEYSGIIVGLEKARELGADVVHCRMDSELACKQLNGEYKVKNPELAKLYLKVHNLRTHFRNTTFTHVRREQNAAADAVVNAAIDAALAQRL